MAKNPDNETHRLIAGIGLGAIAVGILALASEGKLLVQAAGSIQPSESANTVAHTESNWPPTPEAFGQGTLVTPQPEGVTLVNPEDYGEGVEFKVIANNGNIYTVKKISTGQYEIVSPEPKLLSIKYLRRSDIKSIAP